jgi:RNA polymerase sigma factor (sigma-70 family)
MGALIGPDRLQIQEASDEDLVRRTREGDRAAYAQLWERYAALGRRTARAASSSCDPEDVVSEAFAAILAAIRRGGGPTGPFRPYLFATVRNIVTTWGSRPWHVNIDDVEHRLPHAGRADPLEDIDVRHRLADALRRLPERQRVVLWHLEVEGLRPREVAPLMGLSSNAVSALAFRARAGLREQLPEDYAIAS